MSITLDLPQELEDELSAEAARLGLPLSEYIARILVTGSLRSSLPKTGAELVEFWRSEGLVGSHPEIANGQEHARTLRRQAERRMRE